MPYYIYKVFPFHRLEKISEFAVFAEASAAAKSLRQAPDLPPDCRVKVVFADDPFAAETLLTEVRQPGPPLDVDD